MFGVAGVVSDAFWVMVLMLAGLQMTCPLYTLSVWVRVIGVALVLGAVFIAWFDITEERRMGR